MYADYFETREKRKAEYEKYYNDILLKKDIGKEGLEYPEPQPQKA